MASRTVSFTACKPTIESSSLHNSSKSGRLLLDSFKTASTYHNRNGLAGELHAEGLDGAASVVQTTDAVVDIYKFGSGIHKFFDGSELKPGQNPMDEFRRGLYELSGWKLVDDYGDYATLAQKMEMYSDVSSNVDLGYKYIDGALNGEALETILENTKLGKLISGPGKILEKLSDSVS